MGALEVVGHRFIYLDANVFIYRVEVIEPYRSITQPRWQAVTTGSVQIVTSELT